MSVADCFEIASDRLERETTLSRLEARGTLRLALKEAGLDPASVAPSQLRVVVDKVLPGALAARGVERRDEVCRILADCLAALGDAPAADRPEAVFARLAGGR